jgi:hypothetical protein
MNVLSALMRTARRAAHHAWVRLNQGWEPVGDWSGCWKVYETIENVVAFDEYGVRHDASISITTKVAPAGCDDPPVTMYVHTPNGNSLSIVRLTASQVANVIERFARARSDAPVTAPNSDAGATHGGN